MEAVLVSPLRRALVTAALACEGTGLPLELCPAARELASCGGVLENSVSDIGVVRSLLSSLPEGCHVSGLDSLLNARPASDQTVAQLEAMLMERPEGRLMIVCHWGVIRALCGEEPANGEVIECSRCQTTGRLEVMVRHREQR